VLLAPTGGIQHRWRRAQMSLAPLCAPLSSCKELGALRNPIRHLTKPHWDVLVAKFQ
jgi:hypothetical protein